MSQEERQLEENTARLIRAASGAGTCPGAQSRERTFQLLLAHVRARSAEVPFPDAAVGILGGVLVLALIWLVGWGIGTGAPLSANPALLVVVAWLLPNLVLVPVVSIVILKRRQHG